MRIGTLLVAMIPPALLALIVVALIMSFAARDPVRRRRWRIVCAAVGFSVLGTCALIATNLRLGG